MITDDDSELDLVQEIDDFIIDNHDGFDCENFPQIISWILSTFIKAIIQSETTFQTLGLFRKMNPCLHKIY